MSDFDHVRWVGGGSGAGKTTVARLLAGRFGLRLYSTDTTIRVHSERLDATSAPLLERFRRMSMDDRWVKHDPVTMYATFPWFHGEGFDLLIEDLRQIPKDRLVLIEGFRLLPDLVRPLLANPGHAVWLVPASDLRQEAFKRRRAESPFWLRTTDPDQAVYATCWNATASSPTNLSPMLPGTTSRSCTLIAIAPRTGWSRNWLHSSGWVGDGFNLGPRHVWDVDRHESGALWEPSQRSGVAAHENPAADT